MSQVGGVFVTAVPAVPAGSVQAFAGSSAPNGWLLCDGTAVSRTTYSSLFSVVSTTFGAGNGSTTFNVPDLRGRVPMGAGTGNQLNASGSAAILAGTAMTPRTRGAWGGEETHLLSSAEIPAHSHPVSDPGHYHGGLSYAGGGGGPPNNSASFTVGGASSGANSTFGNTGQTTTGLTVSNNTGGGGRHAVVPPFVVLNYIIKWSDDVPRGGMTASWTPPIVTTLPVSPSFGDQVVYAADAANGVYWLLQYDASGTYPWKFVGGAPLLSEVTASQSTASPSYTNLTTTGPALTFPLAGDYSLEIGANVEAQLTAGWRGRMAFTATDADCMFFSGTGAAGAPASGGSGSTKTKRTIAAAATTYTCVYRSDASNAVSFALRFFTATPIRVKAA